MISAPVVFNRVRQVKQEHVLRYWDELSESSQLKLLEQLRAIDFELLDDLTRRFIFGKENSQFAGDLAPADIIPIPQTASQQAEAIRAWRYGEDILRQGKVAAILVAGGQGSRLGFEGPKGKFIATPISRKSLFQMHAEKIKALGIKYKTTIPWLIMTSESNDAETKEFFERFSYFGLDQKDVYFFTQQMIPAIDGQGKLILDRKDHIFTNPNGHGGTLISLKNSGLLAEMKTRGIEELFYFQVDNVLIRICDPCFIGYHSLANADMSAKVVAKKHAHEKVGVIGKLNGKVTVIEYSDLPKSEMEATTPDGKLKYNGGSIAIHLIKLNFIEKLTSKELNLPYHVAHKKIPFIDDNGNLVIPESPNGYKFEMFIFDALAYAKNCVVIEVVREDEFSPIKNLTGEDSPDTARRDLINYYGRMLNKLGVDVPFDQQHDVQGALEISPFLAMDENELKSKLGPDFKFTDNFYLE